jgi:hypothetical protein
MLVWLKFNVFKTVIAYTLLSVVIAELWRWFPSKKAEFTAFTINKGKCLYSILWLLIEFSYNRAPQLKHMAAAQPLPKRRLPCRNDGVGLQLRGHVCGLD